MQKAGTNILLQCLAVKPGEKVLVVTDGLLEKNIDEYFVKLAKKLTNKVKLLAIKPTGQHGAEPDKQTASKMARADVCLLTTYYSLSHTKARKNACSAGARIASMPGITWDTIERTLTINYKQVAKLSKKVAGLLTMADSARLTSPAGTDLKISLQGRDAIADTGLFTNSGDFGNLPAGEAFVAPLEGKTQGKLVFESVYGDKKLDFPVSFVVKNGKVLKASKNTPQSQIIETELDKIGSKARNIAELGIGTNKATTSAGGLLELEKIYGTAHIALGNNAYFGGEVDVPYHIDGLVLKPTLILDKKIVIKNGKFVL